MSGNNILVTCDASKEILASTNSAARGVMDTMGFTYLDSLEEVATSATVHSLGRVTKLAEYIGVSDEILDIVKTESLGLLLPSQDDSNPRRIEISNNYGARKTTVVKPNLQLLKQVFLTTQATYGEVIGFDVPEEDYTNIRRESLGYIHRYGIGMSIMAKMEEKIATGNKIFRQQDRERGINSFSSFFATYLADPSSEELQPGDEWHAEYTNKFPGWAFTIKEVIQKINVNRRDEFNDYISIGLIRPMSIEEAEETVSVAKQKMRPRFSIV